MARQNHENVSFPSPWDSAVSSPELWLAGSATSSPTSRRSLLQAPSRRRIPLGSIGSGSNGRRWPRGAATFTVGKAELTVGPRRIPPQTFCLTKVRAANRLGTSSEEARRHEIQANLFSRRLGDPESRRYGLVAIGEAVLEQREYEFVPGRDIRDDAQRALPAAGAYKIRTCTTAIWPSGDFSCGTLWH